MIEKVWDCDTCKIVEPVSQFPEEGYNIGDHEPCIYCDGVTYVRLKKSPHGRYKSIKNLTRGLEEANA